MGAKSGLLALAAIGLMAAGCGPPMRWDKPGVTAENLLNDQFECRRAAADEAFHTYPVYPAFGIAGAWGYGHRYDYILWRQRIDNDRFFYESRLANFCMRNKGYTQVPVNEQAATPK